MCAFNMKRFTLIVGKAAGGFVTATARPFVHGGPRRAGENCNCKTFCPRRAAKGGGELQLQHLLSTKGREGPRRTTKNCNCRRATAELQLQHFLSAKGGGELQQQDLLSTKGREGPRRATKNCNCRRATAELFCPDVNGSWLSRSHLASLLLGNLRYWGSFAAY